MTVLQSHALIHHHRTPYSSHTSLTRTTVDARQTVQTRGTWGTLQTGQAGDALFSLGAIATRGPCTHRQVESGNTDRWSQVTQTGRVEEHTDRWSQVTQTG